MILGKKIIRLRRLAEPKLLATWARVGRSFAALLSWVNLPLPVQLYTNDNAGSYIAPPYFSCPQVSPPMEVSPSLSLSACSPTCLPYSPIHRLLLTRPSFPHPLLPQSETNTSPSCSWIPPRPPLCHVQLPLSTTHSRSHPPLLTPLTLTLSSNSTSEHTLKPQTSTSALLSLPHSLTHSHCHRAAAHRPETKRDTQNADPDTIARDLHLVRVDPHTACFHAASDNAMRMRMAMVQCRNIPALL